MSGKVDASDASCKDEEGGDVFYGYLSNKYKGSRWKQSSSNTGFTLKEAAAMYFVIDGEANGYWVVTVDAPGNSSLEWTGREFSMTLKDLELLELASVSSAKTTTTALSFRP